MKIIGITGKSGSGKSTLAKLLSEQFNCNVINVDKIGHKATSDVENAKKLCESKLQEFKDRDAREAEKFAKAWNESREQEENKKRIIIKR